MVCRVFRSYAELSVLRYLVYLSLVSGLGLVMYCLYNLSLVRIDLTVVACTSGNLVIQVQHRFSFKKIG